MGVGTMYHHNYEYKRHIDSDFMERNGGNKRVYAKVCHYWREGRCTRYNCPFLHDDPPKHQHQKPPLPSDGAVLKRNQYQGALVWRNPSSTGGGKQSNWGRDRGNGVGATNATASTGGQGSAGAKTPVSTARTASDKSICLYFLKGRCNHAEGCRYLHSWSIGESFSLLTPLEGHHKVVTGIALPSGSNKLYSGSTDETVRIWDCQTGQCVQIVKLGGEVGCLISEGPWVFIGIPNSIKAWNHQTGVELNLDGPNGKVYALVVGNDMLFAGVQDGNILAWKFSTELNCFLPAASLSGHQGAVVSLVVGAMRLYSGCMDHTIRVWDLATLQCTHTLTGHTEVVMSLLCWDQFLLSCSLDQTIKVWVATRSGGLEVTYTHSEEHGVLVLAGMHDAQAKPVLLCSCNDNTVHLYDLPSFSERGKLFCKEEVRAIQIGPGGLFFTGDGTGELKVWNWSTSESQSAC